MGKYFIFQIWGVRTEIAALCQWGVLYGLIVVRACGLGFNMKQGLATFLVEWIQLKMARYFLTMMVNGVGVENSFQGEPDHRIALLRLWGLLASGSWLHSRKQVGGCAGYHQRKGTTGCLQPPGGSFCGKDSTTWHVTAGAGPLMVSIASSFMLLGQRWSREKWLSNPKDNWDFQNLNIFLCQRPQKGTRDYPWPCLMLTCRNITLWRSPRVP